MATERTASPADPNGSAALELGQMIVAAHPPQAHVSPTFTAPPRQSGRLAARERENTRPAYSPKVLYFASRPT